MLNINLNLILTAEMIEDILDGFILLSGVTLPWNLYHGGINHWSFRGRKTVLRPKLVPRLKRFFAPSCRGCWGLKSQMDFGLVLRLRMSRQDSKPDRPKRNAILDLKLQLIVRPVGAGIHNHDLDLSLTAKGFGSWSRTIARV